MPVIRTYVPESLQNYNHLVYCDHNGLAAAVDPYNADHLLALAEDNSVKITQIWITHEHGDHIRHLDELKIKTGAAVFAPAACKGKFLADHWLSDGESLNLGHLEAHYWFTPGHTPGHGVFYIAGESPELLCGDTLFNAGVGNTRSGNVETLFQSLSLILERCASDTVLYPGHDYLINNLKFALSLEPNQSSALQWLEQCVNQTPQGRATTTLNDEYQFNPFLRLSDPGLIEALQIRGCGTHTPLERFTALRQLRDQW